MIEYWTWSTFFGLCALAVPVLFILGLAAAFAFKGLCLVLGPDRRR